MESESTNGGQAGSLVPLRTIGKGSFGKVILAATSDANPAFVAVKVMAKSRLQRKAQVERAAVELRVLQEIGPSSNHIVHCLHAYQTDDLVICVMEYCGKDLRTYLRKTGRLSESATKHIASQVVQGVAHLHMFGLLYRDLKPDNVLISQDGIVRLADFGLSKFLRPKGLGGMCFAPIRGKSNASRWGLTRTACGTPVYQCPEMLKGEVYGLDADWWAFGVLLFELLNERPPFCAETVAEVHNLILANDIQFPEHMSSEAKSLVTSLLRKRRRDRVGFSDYAGQKILGHPFFVGVDKTKRCIGSCKLYELALHDHVEDLSMKSTEFIPEFISTSDSSIHVAGYQTIPNDTFSRFVTMGGSSDRSIMSSCSSSGSILVVPS